MTALILQVTPFAEVFAPALKRAYARVLHALDAFVENRMRHAVPEHELRRAEREIARYHRLMNCDHRSPAKKRAGR
jgi:hypothetical protein